MNIIPRQEFELAYYDVAVLQVTPPGLAMKNLPTFKKSFCYFFITTFEVDLLSNGWNK